MTRTAAEVEGRAGSKFWAAKLVNKAKGGSGRWGCDKVISIIIGSQGAQPAQIGADETIVGKVNNRHERGGEGRSSSCKCKFPMQKHENMEPGTETGENVFAINRTQMIMHERARRPLRGCSTNWPQWGDGRKHACLFIAIVLRLVVHFFFARFIDCFSIFGLFIFAQRLFLFFIVLSYRL